MFFRKQIKEIASDKALRGFGAVLALSHALTVLFWQHYGYLVWFSDQIDPICWPGLSFCDQVTRLSFQTISLSTQIYAAVSVVVAALFLLPRAVALGFFSLLALTIGKVLFMSLDVRSSHNAHIILFYLSAIFFFVKNKNLSLRLSLVSVYFYAGIIKCNQFWLSGDALGRLPEALEVLPLPLMTWCVLLLELVGVWTLLFRNRIGFWIGYLQYLVFQLISMLFIGFYFPSVMIGLILFFPLDRILNKRGQNSILAELSGLSPKALVPTAVVILIFTMLQFLPGSISVQPNLTGEGKFVAMHMFDRKVRCTAKATLLLPDSDPKEVDFFPDVRTTPGRLVCNPLSYYWLAKASCERGQISNNDFSDMSLSVSVRYENEGEESLRPLIDIGQVCQRFKEDSGFVYRAFFHNDWILID